MTGKPHQGEVLRNLIHKDPLKNEEIATLWGISPEYLSRVKRLHEIPEPIIERAMSYFGVPRDVFDRETTIEQPASIIDHNKLDRLQYLLQSALAENEKLREEVSYLRGQLTAAMRREIDLIAK